VLNIQLLGTFQIRRDGAPLAGDSGPTPKARAVLALLLTERPRVVPKDRLIEHVWPDLAPRSAANSLRVSINQLRHLLEPELDRAADSAFIRTHAEGYRFEVAGTCRIDVDDFHSVVAEGQACERRGEWGPAIAAFRAAGDLYRGDYLADDPYADWAAAPREQMREALLDCLSRLADCHAHLGQFRRALAACHEILARDALREAAYRQVMAYHHRLGQRDQALRAFDRCRRLLADELGVDPMPQTLELHARILRDEPIDTAPRVLVAPPAPVAARVPVPDQLPFLGREAETATLAGHWQAAVEGTGRLVLIAGEAGIGKTRLAEEVAGRAAAQGARVLRGRAYEVEQDLPFQPVREALRDVLGTLDPDRAQAALGRWAPHVAGLVPEVHRLVPGLAALDPIPPAEERHRLLAGLNHFIVALAASRPVLWVIDDLQWADPSTLQLLHFVVRHIAREPVLLVGTVRAEDIGADHPLARIERNLARERLAVRLALQPLTADAVQRMVAALAEPGWNSRAFGQRLYAETEGRPLYLAELWRSLLESGLLVAGGAGRYRPSPGVDLVRRDLEVPATVRAVIEARCRAAGEVGRRVLEAAAVIGRAFDVELLQAAAGVETDALLDVLDRLVARQLIRERSEAGHGGHVFSHDRIREVLYDGLGEARKAHLHRRVATAIEARPPAGDVAAELAFHFTRAGELDRALTHRLAAGAAALAAHATDEALAQFDQALALCDRMEPSASGEAARRLVEQRYDAMAARVAILGRLGRRKDAAAACEALIATASRLGDDGRLAAARIAYADHLAETGRFQDAVRTAEQVLADATRAADLDAQARALAAMARALGRMARYEPAIEPAERALAIARRLGDRRREAEYVNILGGHAVALGDYEAGLARYREALAIARELGWRHREGMQVGNVAFVLWHIGDYAAALEMAEQALAIGREVGDRNEEARGHINAGRALHHLGRSSEAAAHLRAAVAMGRAVGQPYYLTNALNYLALVLLAPGDPPRAAEAAALADEAVALAQALHLVHAEIYGLSLRALAALECGDPTAALTHSSRAVERLAAHGHIEGAEEEIHFNHARVLRAAGDAAAADRYLDLARAELMAKADRFAGAGLRRTFLEQVAINRAIAGAAVD